MLKAGKTAVHEHQIAGDPQPAEDDAAGRGKTAVDIGTPGDTLIPALAGIRHGSGKLHGVGVADQNQVQVFKAPLCQLPAQDAQYRLVLIVADGHGAGETADHAVSLAVVVHREGEAKGHILGPIQQWFQKLRSGEDQILQGGGIFPAGNREAVPVRKRGRSILKGYQGDPDVPVVDLGHSHGLPVRQRTKGL